MKTSRRFLRHAHSLRSVANFASETKTRVIRSGAWDLPLDDASRKQNLSNEPVFVRSFSRVCGIRITDRLSRLSLFFEHLNRVPCFVRRLLFVFERPIEIHLGQEIVRIEFEEA